MRPRSLPKVVHNLTNEKGPQTPGEPDLRPVDRLPFSRRKREKPSAKGGALNGKLLRYLARLVWVHATDRKPVLFRQVPCKLHQAAKEHFNLFAVKHSFLFCAFSSVRASSLVFTAGLTAHLAPVPAVPWHSSTSPARL